MVVDMQSEPVEDKPRGLEARMITVTVEAAGTLLSSKCFGEAWNMGCMTGIAMSVSIAVDAGEGAAAFAIMDQAWGHFGEPIVERVSDLDAIPCGWTRSDANARLCE